MPTSRLAMSRRPVLVMGLALAVRVLYDLQLRAADPAFAQPMLDARWHVQWAMGIAQGDFWGTGVFFRAPLYPYALALVFHLFGPGLLVPRLVQAVFGAATAGLVYGLGDRLAGRDVGLLAGLAAALYGPLVYHDGELLLETLYLPLLAGGLLLALDAAKSGRAWTWSAAGFAMGLATITRPNVLLFAPVLVAWIAWEKRRACARPALAWVLAAALPVVLVTVRNGVIGGEYVVVASQGGANFYIGNSAEADGKTATTPGAGFQAATFTGYFYRDSVDESSRVVAERAAGRPLRAGEVSRFWFARSFAWIGSHPREWTALLLRKAYFLANGYEIPSNRDLYQAREWAGVLRGLVTKDPLALPFGLVWPLAMAGIAFATPAAARRRTPPVDGPAHRLLLLFLLVYAATVVAFFVTSRHRLPLVPVVLPYASLAVLSFVEAARRKRLDFVTLVAAATLAAGLALSNGRLHGVRDDVLNEAEFHLGLGEVHARAGRLPEAIGEFQAAVRVDPGMERGWFDLGVALTEAKRYEAALGALQRALDLAPGFAPAWSQVGNVHLETGMLEQAAAYYRRALELDPSLAVAHYNFALALGRSGDRAGYSRELEAAVRSDPYFVPAVLDLAQERVAARRVEEARALLERVLQVDPGNERARAMAEAPSR